MNKQQLFDTALNGIRKQNYAVSAIETQQGTKCLYRGPNGTKCHIGHALPDELYDPEMDNFDNGVTFVKLLRWITVETLFEGVSISFGTRLQNIHDNQLEHGKDHYEQCMQEFAKDNNLDYTAP